MLTPGKGSNASRIRLGKYKFETAVGSDQASDRSDCCHRRLSLRTLSGFLARRPPYSLGPRERCGVPPGGGSSVGYVTQFRDALSSLQAVVENLKHRHIEKLSPELRNLILFDRSATARHLGSI